MKTLSILIGNSDDKLTQARWVLFCSEVHDAIGSICFCGGAHKHFEGYSQPTSPWQNACWIIQVEEKHIQEFSEALKKICATFSQESIALVIGETTFVSP